MIYLTYSCHGQIFTKNPCWYKYRCTQTCRLYFKISMKGCLSLESWLWWWYHRCMYLSKLIWQFWVIIFMQCWSIHATPIFVLQQLKSRLVEHHEEVPFAYIMPTCVKYFPTVTFRLTSSCSRLFPAVNTRINAEVGPLQRKLNSTLMKFELMRFYKHITGIGLTSVNSSWQVN